MRKSNSCLDIMMRLQMAALTAVKADFESYGPEGLTLEDFVTVLLKRLMWTNTTVVELVDELVDLFGHIGQGTMVWDDFTSALIDAGMATGLNETQWRDMKYEENVLFVDSASRQPKHVQYISELRKLIVFEGTRPVYDPTAILATESTETSIDDPNSAPCSLPLTHEIHPLVYTAGYRRDQDAVRSEHSPVQYLTTLDILAVSAGDLKLSFWNCAIMFTSEIPNPMELVTTEHPQRILEWAPAASRLFTVSIDNRILVWMVAMKGAKKCTVTCTHVLDKHKDIVQDLLLVNDDTLISCSMDSLILIWDPHTLQCKSTRAGHKYPWKPTSFTLFHNGTTIVACGYRVKWIQRVRLKPKLVASNAVLYNDHSFTVLSTTDKGTSKGDGLLTYASWDKSLPEWKAHSLGIRSICVVDDPKCIFTCSFDKSTKVWAYTGECLGERAWEVEAFKYQARMEKIFKIKRSPMSSSKAMVPQPRIGDNAPSSFMEVSQVDWSELPKTSLTALPQLNSTQLTQAPYDDKDNWKIDSKNRQQMIYSNLFSETQLQGKRQPKLMLENIDIAPSPFLLEKLGPDKAYKKPRYPLRATPLSSRLTPSQSLPARNNAFTTVKPVHLSASIARSIKLVEDDVADKLSKPKKASTKSSKKRSDAADQSTALVHKAASLIVAKPKPAVETTKDRVQADQALLLKQTFGNSASPVQSIPTQSIVGPYAKEMVYEVCKLFVDTDVDNSGSIETKEFVQRLVRVQGAEMKDELER
ncbi:hypothetical protein DYB32_007762 [Aphanomyces invadans]|uniref:Uncharacterized protein n=1 Tax=Aphanomyces invadans TaxID=157072 RepID=A0A3R6Y483_9STRA|nr:hypothetical protein DYB32_007762 [Aphanomyces invadans]